MCVLTRFRSLKSTVQLVIKKFIFKGPLCLVLSCICFSLLLINFIGNFPLIRVLPFYYGFTFWLRFIFWLPLLIRSLITNRINFFSHLLPYGCPRGLMFMLPLVELVSQFIRPFTLIVRLRTNLAAGHIILYIFSYFTLLSNTLFPLLSVILFLLFILEIFISLLQAYIFATLLLLYYQETV